METKTTAQKRTAMSVIDKIKVDSREIDKLKRELSKLQSRNDANVVRARNSGLKFREIADASGRSVSWVQAVIRRDGSSRDKAGATSTNGDSGDGAAAAAPE